MHLMGRDWKGGKGGGGGVEERGCNECHNCFVKRLDEEVEAARACIYKERKSTVKLQELNVQTVGNILLIFSSNLFSTIVF